MTDREIMQQALDALEIAEVDGNCYYEATELLRNRLAHCDRCGKLAAWMMAQGYATGHGDTTEDLLKELEWQVRESEREACAALCDQLSDSSRDLRFGAAVRARGQA